MRIIIINSIKKKYQNKIKNIDVAVAFVVYCLCCFVKIKDFPSDSHIPTMFDTHDNIVRRIGGRHCEPNTGFSLFDFFIITIM